MDDGSFNPSATTVYRDRFYRQIFALIERRAAAGDSFVGDPPHEPRGLYCVFDSDASTITIVKAHAEQMDKLR